MSDQNSFNELLQPVWRIQLNGVIPYYLERYFPEYYPESTWAKWIQIIKQGKSIEEQAILDVSKMYSEARLESELACAGISEEDYLSDEVYEIESVTNSMHAALIVSIWSEIEHILKSLLRIIYSAKEIQSEIPHQFDKIKKAFKKELSVKLALAPNYNIVNSIRILNNIYKHADGYYSHRSKEKLDVDLLLKWKIEKNKKINYLNLPISEIIDSCHEFFSILLSEINENINKL